MTTFARLALRTAFAVAAFAGAAAFDARNDAKADGLWCAEVGGRGASTNCGFFTFKQCLDTIHGLGGFCRPNPRVELVEDVEIYEVAPRRYHRYH